jgi:hypothetical protein
VDRFYSLINEFRVTQDPTLLARLNELLEPIRSSYFATPEGSTGYMFGDVTLNPLIVKWIAHLRESAAQPACL